MGSSTDRALGFGVGEAVVRIRMDDREYPWLLAHVTTLDGNQWEVARISDAEVEKSFASLFIPTLITRPPSKVSI